MVVPDAARGGGVGRPARRALTAAALLCAVLLSGSCGDGGDAQEPRPDLPEALTSFFERLLVDARTFREVDGGWTEDYGDAPFYGLALYTRLGAERSNAAFAARAARARAYDLTVVRQANADRDWYLANMEEAIMAALGLIEHAAQTGDDADLADIDAFVDGTDALVSLFGDYLPNGADIGVMQVNWPTWSQFVTDLGYTRDDLANPAVNLLIAKLISEEAEAIGWRWCQPWDNSGRWCS